MSRSGSDVPVLIVGGGPSGLAASLTLSRLGVAHVLVERHATPLHHPKAVGVMQRTAELLRGWGAEEEMRERGVPSEFGGQMVWTTTLAGEELGRTATPDPQRRPHTAVVPVRRDHPTRPYRRLRASVAIDQRRRDPAVVLLNRPDLMLVAQLRDLVGGGAGA